MPAYAWVYEVESLNSAGVKLEPKILRWVLNNCFRLPEFTGMLTAVSVGSLGFKCRFGILMVPPPSGSQL